MKKVIINQIARFFSTKYRVRSKNIALHAYMTFNNGEPMNTPSCKLTATVKAAG